jgi:hypothetical protein
MLQYIKLHLMPNGVGLAVHRGVTAVVAQVELQDAQERGLDRLRCTVTVQLQLLLHYSNDTVNFHLVLALGQDMFPSVLKALP